MAGTPKNYNKDEEFIGSVDVWLMVAKPAAGAVATLHTDRTPESVANPSAIHLGVTVGDDSVRFTYTPTLQEFFVNQFRAPWRRRITAEAAAITGTWQQVFSFDLLEAMTIGGTRTTPTGFERLGFGGLVEPDTFSVMLIGELSSAPGETAIVQLYEAMNMSGLEMTFNNNSMTNSPFNFVGNVDPTRAAGDQIGYLAIST